jgi:hypothetical protein
MSYPYRIGAAGRESPHPKEEDESAQHATRDYFSAVGTSARHL